MYKYALILIYLFCGSLYALDFSVEVLPKEPIAGESFNVVFKVESKDGDDPLISFNPRRVEVLSREQTGIATRTTYINGKLTVNRTITVNYEMVAAKPGTAYLQQVEVELNGEKKRHPTVRMRILKEAKKEKDVFVRAEVDKTEAFVGESITLRYYLYHKRQVTSMDIKKFPTLGKFMKRFHQEPQNAERVQLNSGVYYRRIIYTSQLFSNNIGKAKVDSISLAVQYPYGRANSPFSNFGFNTLRTKKVTLRSKPVEITIKALPENPPAGFTGLVGPHEFDFKINKSKFLVNEPIEIDFTVRGKGNLELYEEPKFVDSPKVEEFDSSNDLTISKDFSAQKKFKITYLARENGAVAAREIPLVYFDAEQLKFVTKMIKVPEIKIAGKALPVVETKTRQRRAKAKAKTLQKSSSANLDPVYKLKNTLIYNQNIILGVFALIFLLYGGRYVYNRGLFQFKARDLGLLDIIEKRGASYSDFFELISLLNDGANSKERILQSKLSEKVKEELLSKQQELDTKYSKNSTFKVKVSKKALKELKGFLGKNG